MKFHSSDNLPRFCTTFWTFSEQFYPAASWPEARKLDAMVAAGFDGIHDSLIPAQIRAARSRGLDVVGRLDGRFEDSWQESLRQQAGEGVTLFNVHLGFHDTPTETAARRAHAIHLEATRLRVRAQTEIHRGTATETPERFDALRSRFEELAGEPLPTTWDHSHFAVMKHLLPGDGPTRLLRWETELQASHLLHCRPFNGQHAQIPVTDATGAPTPEFSTYLEFARTLFRCWQAGPLPRPTPLWICPEMGATEGYHLSTFPDPWKDAVTARDALRDAWISVYENNERHE